MKTKKILTLSKMKKDENDVNQQKKKDINIELKSYKK